MKLRCTLCGFEIDDEGKELTCCPNCGDKGVPCDVAKDVEVTINWHELHILCVWAENYANAKCGGAGVVYAIAERLRQQHPELGPLTLAGEINSLKDAGFKISHNIPGAEGGVKL